MRQQLTMTPEGLIATSGQNNKFFICDPFSVDSPAPGVLRVNFYSERKPASVSLHKTSFALRPKYSAEKLVIGGLRVNPNKKAIPLLMEAILIPEEVKGVSCG